MFLSKLQKTALAAVIGTGLSLTPAYAQFDPVEAPLAEAEITEDDSQQNEYGGTADSGVIGNDNTRPAAYRPGTPGDAPPSLPPVFDGMTGEGAAIEEAAEEDLRDENDPCAEYEDGDGYNMCQDRIRKIERMRDAKNRRMDIAPAQAAPAAQQPANDAPAATGSGDKATEAVNKVEELEKRLKEKEEAEAARKAAPTTKKGIGAFDRNPEKGTPLFK